MNNDLELRTRLTADASGLADAFRQADRNTQAYVRGVEGAGAAVRTTATAEREAVNAVTTATAQRKAFLDTLREQVALYGKSTEEVLRYRAAQAGVTDQAAPLIQQLKAQRLAQEAAAEAAREEAQAQREAAQARRSAEAAQQAFIRGLQDQLELQGKSSGDALRYQARQLGIGPEAESLIARYEATLGKAGVTAGQTAAAMRMLPAQITDITTSLAAGMPVWMVAIQQGGQIKDSFGGIGPAFTALRAAISPVALAAGGLAAVLGAVTLAWYQGQKQSRAYERAILMSGNAAGTTTSRLTAMSQAVAQVIGTQRGAAGVLNQLVGTGQVADRNLQAFTITAQRMEEQVGVAVATTVKNFEELGRAPLQKTIELNKQYGYLTLAVYEQIKALERQGRVQEAGELAQKAFNDAADARMKELQKSQGLIERGWIAIKTEAGRAWDAMLAVGRKNTTQMELDAVNAQLKALDSKRAQGATDDAMARAMFGDAAPVNGQRSNDAAREALRARQAELQEMLRLEGRAAEAQAAERAKVNTTVENEKRVDEERKALTSARLARIKDELAGMTGAYADADRIIEQQRAGSLLDEATYWEAKRALIAANAQAQVSALEQENRVLSQQQALGAERIQRDQQVASNQAEIARIRAKAAADTVIANAQEAAGIRQMSLALQQYTAQLLENETARERQHTRELATLGRGDEARALAGRQNAIDDRYIQARNQLDAERRTSQLTETEYQQRLAVLREFYKRALEAEVGYQRELQAAQMDGSLGMQRALENYADRARDVAGQTEQLFSNAFTTMEDAVVQFAMTGKLSFREFAESVIADLVRIYVKQQLVGLFTQAANYMFGPTGSSSGGSGQVPADVVHGGGVVGTDNLTKRMAPADGWANAPRFHTGLKSDEYRAILQRGESVLTPAQMRQLAPVGSQAAAPVVNMKMELNLVNNSGTPLKATSSQRADGGLDILLEAVESAVAANVSSGVGPLAGAIQSRYGLQPSMAS